VKRSVSVPPELDAAIVAAAARLGLTYSGWLARAADRALTIEGGLAASSASLGRRAGRFTAEEAAAAEASFPRRRRLCWRWHGDLIGRFCC
jgi:hypothetical protein